MNIIEKVKMLFKLKKIFNQAKEVSKMKAGWKTTEFWLAVASVVISLWFTFQGMIPAELALKVMGAVAMVYQVARTIVKATPSMKDDELLAKIEEMVKSAKK